MRWVVFVLLFCGVLPVFVAAVDGPFSCDMFPDKNLIIRKDNTVMTAVVTELISDADLPDDWAYQSLTTLDYEKVIERRRLSQLAQYYVSAEFDSAQVQYFSTPDTKLVYVLTERFNNSQKLGHLLTQYKNIFSRASNIADYEGLSKYGQSGVAGRYMTSTPNEYIILFRKGNELIRIETEDEQACHTVAKAISDYPGDLTTDSVHEWEATVCESHSSECNQKIYVNSIYEHVDIERCRVLSKGSWIDCKLNKIRKYSNNWEIPFPSCEKGDKLILEYERETAFPIKNRIWKKIYVNQTNPVEKFSLTLNIPQKTNIKYETKDWIEPRKTVKDGKDQYIWTAENIPPHTREPY